MAAPTLDDVSLDVLQLEPEDRAGLGRARERLTEVALATRTGVAAQPYVARAVKALGPLADGTAADPAAAMREVGRLLQCATAAVAVPPRAERPRLPADLAEELVTAHAVLAQDPGFAELLGRDRAFATRAAQLGRVVREVRRLLARDVQTADARHVGAGLDRH